MNGERLRPSYPACEAPKHIDGCNGIGNTRDHITPKSILKALGFKKPEYWNRDENKQYLSELCHREKDAITPWELQAVLKNGGTKTMWEHHNELIIFKYGMPQLPLPFPKAA